MSNSVSLEYLNAALAPKTANILCVQNTAGSAITVLLGGAAVSLPSRVYMNGFSADSDNETFTALQAGVYRIFYRITTTAGLGMSSAVYLNGDAVGSLTRRATVSLSDYICSAVVSLAAGDRLQLVMFGLLGSAVLQGGVGAELTVIQLA